MFDAHTDGVDENSNHNAPTEVLALHDAPQLHPGVVPQAAAALAAVLKAPPPSDFRLVRVAAPAAVRSVSFTRAGRNPVAERRRSSLGFVMMAARWA